MSARIIRLGNGNTTRGSAATSSNNHVERLLDSKLSLTGGTLTGKIRGLQVLYTPQSTFDDEATSWAQLRTGLSSLSTSIFTRLHTDPLLGNLDLGGHSLLNVKTPSDPKHGANKTYVDTKLSLTGGTMTGGLDMRANKITNLANPEKPLDAANKAYVSSNYLSLAGGQALNSYLNMSNNRILNVMNPVLPMDAVNRRYVDGLFLTGYSVDGSITSTEITLNDVPTTAMISNVWFGHGYREYEYRSAISIEAYGVINMFREATTLKIQLEKIPAVGGAWQNTWRVDILAKASTL